MRFRHLIFLLAGCNGLLGLDSTRVEDRDGDGIVDALDNCPDLENADQLDADDDGAGDRCDPCDGCVVCDKGPQHDEDGDKHIDGCDNCPTVANTDQANDDGDDVGNDCDADDTIVHRRRVFDGFGTLDLEKWQLVGGGFRIVDDALEPLDEPADLGNRLVLRDAPIVGVGRWTVETTLVVPEVPSEGLVFGLKTDEADGGNVWSCLVEYLQGTWEIVNGLPQAITLPGGDYLLVSSSEGTTTQSCQVVGVGSKDNNLTAPFEYPLAPEVFARSANRYDYLEVIQIEP